MSFKKQTKNIFILILIIGLVYVSFLQYKISEYSHIEPPKQADYLIVLGTAVKGTVPSRALSARINTAAKYLKENKDTIVIASGGKGPKEDISEAESIKLELIKKGIESSRIIKEDRSTDTKENIRFSKEKLIPYNNLSGIIVTNNFHMYRSLSIAHDQGLKVNGLPASTPFNAIFKLYTREYLAITKYYLLKYVF